MTHRVPSDPVEHLRIAFMAGAMHGAAWGWGYAGRWAEPLPLPRGTLLEEQWLRWFAGAHDHSPELVRQQTEPCADVHFVPPLGPDPAFELPKRGSV